MLVIKATTKRMNIDRYARSDLDEPVPQPIPSLATIITKRLSEFRKTLSCCDARAISTEGLLRHLLLCCDSVFADAVSDS